MEQYVDWGINGALILGAIAFVCAFVLGPLVSLITNPKDMIKTVIGIALLVGLIFIVYTLAPGDMSGIFQTSKYADNVTPGQMKLVEGGIYGALALLGITIVTLLFSLVVDIFR